MTWYNKIKINSLFKKAQRAKKLPSATGDCFKVATNYIIENSILRGNKDLVLVHGIVTGQGPVFGVKYQHAWVENNNTVIDMSNGKNVSISKDLYYAIGKILNTKRYVPNQVRKMLLKHKHYGPW
jgi:hypothetical protein